MQSLKEQIGRALEEAGVSVLEAMPWKSCDHLERPNVCVAVKGMEARDGAMYRYLGMDETGRERYGMQLKLEAELTVLSPKSGGQSTCQAYLERVFMDLLRGIPGFPVLEAECSEISYHQIRDCFTAAISVKTAVMAYRIEETGGVEVTEFRIKTNVQ